MSKFQTAEIAFLKGRITLYSIEHTHTHMYVHTKASYTCVSTSI